MSLLSLAW